MTVNDVDIVDCGMGVYIIGRSVVANVTRCRLRGTRDAYAEEVLARDLAGAVHKQFCCRLHAGIWVMHEFGSTVVEDCDVRGFTHGIVSFESQGSGKAVIRSSCIVDRNGPVLCEYRGF